MPNNSLFVSRNSLFLRNNSLFPNRRVPDQNAVKWRLFRSKGDLGGPESSKFPVIFPVSREFAVETGSLRTAPTASHPRPFLSAERRGPKVPRTSAFFNSPETLHAPRALGVSALSRPYRPKISGPHDGTNSTRSLPRPEVSLVDSDKRANPLKNLAVAYRPVDSLEPYARNSRTHSNAQIKQIAASITEFGSCGRFSTPG
jgi:hypothetical protein